MSRRPEKKPARPPGPEAAQSKQLPALNPRLYVQTRKILSKHYRAKYGMRQGRGGR